VRPFQVDLISYSPLIPNSKIVHVLSHSEYPASAFAFVEHSNGQMLVADNTFIALMNKLKLYVHLNYVYQKWKHEVQD